MKVTHVVPSDSFAGVERYVALVAPRLATLGCDVTVVGGDEGAMRRVLGGLRWLPATSLLDITGVLRSVPAQDIIHAHMTAAEVAAVITKPVHRAKVVSTLHFASTRGKSIAGRLARPLAIWLDAEVALSEFVAQRTGATHVIQGGVESVDASRTRSDETVLVLQRLETEKQTSVALHAWAMSSLRDRGWRLQMAGRGAQCDELRQLADKLGVSESVDWLGYVEDSGPLLARTRALIATTPYEAFGMTVVEAMARATPVLAAHGGAHVETLGSGGWFFPPGDAAACAQLLNKLELSEVDSYGAELQARQRRFFDITAHAERVKELYDEVVGLLR